MYRWVATSVAGFVQQLAVAYVTHGYWFYVCGRVPESKSPSLIDDKLIERYGIAMSKWNRARRKRAGLANMHYLRHERFFVLLATHGTHRFFAEEGAVVRDLRRTPVKYASYSVSYRGGHAHVRLDNDTYRELKSFFLEASVRTSAEALAAAVWRLPIEPYAPVRRQVLNIWRAINAARNRAGLAPLPIGCVRLRRRIVRPFEPCE